MKVKNWNIWIMMIIVALCAFAATMLIAGDSAYDTGTTAAEVTFGPNPYSQTVIKAIAAESDKAASVVKIYSKTAKYFPTTSPTNGATVIAIANTGTAVTNGDHVVYWHADGTVDKTTVASATTSNITLAAAITVAGADGDAVYELGQDWQIDLGAASLEKTGDIYYSPADSPVYVVADGTSACFVAVSIDND